MELISEEPETTFKGNFLLKEETYNKKEEQEETVLIDEAELWIQLALALDRIGLILFFCSFSLVCTILFSKIH
jgi:hypothetical protein